MENILRMKEEEALARYSTRNYGFDIVAITKELDKQREELSRMTPDEARIVAAERLKKAGLVGGIKTGKEAVKPKRRTGILPTGIK